MVISCVIPTYRREDKLARAVQSVLGQQVGDEFEIIVLNDAGEPLSPADWQEDPRVRVYDTNHVNRCFARNAGLSVARGEWMHFLDDDDYMLPGAYAALLARARELRAEWTYGAYNCEDDDGQLIETISPTLEGNVFAHGVAGTSIPMQSSLIRRNSVLEVGGFDPDFIPGQDRDLIVRIALSGTFAVCPAVVASIRVGPEGATTTPWSKSRLTGILMREKRFAEPQCLPRLFESLSKAENPAVLRGRLARFYGASALRHAGRSPLTALSRALVALRFVVAGIPNRRLIRGLRGGW